MARRRSPSRSFLTKGFNDGAPTPRIAEHIVMTVDCAAMLPPEAGDGDRDRKVVVSQEKAGLATEAAPKQVRHARHGVALLGQRPRSLPGM
jgi:hypothetical protein